MKGVYEILDRDKDKIVITELPIGTWTMNYLTFLEELIDGDKKKSGTAGSDKKKKVDSIVKDFINMSTDIHVHITVQLEKGKLAELESIVDANGINGLEKALKLSTTVNTTNMNMFNEKRQLHKYKNVEEIIDAYFIVRLDMYEKRKNAQVKIMKARVQELSNRERFILEVVANTLDLRKCEDDAEMDLVLTGKQYDKQNDKFDYLTHMPMHTMNKTRVQKLANEKKELIVELDILQKTELTTMWLRELNNLEKEYIIYKDARKKMMESGSSKKVVVKKTKK